MLYMNGPISVFIHQLWIVKKFMIGDKNSLNVHNVYQILFHLKTECIVYFKDASWFKTVNFVYQILVFASNVELDIASSTDLVV